MREVLDELELDYERDKDEHHYTRMMVVIPMPQFAYVFKFQVKDLDFTIKLFDTRPTHAGVYHHIEVKDITRSNIKTIKKILQRFAKTQKRKPYKFNFYERLRTGLVLPEYLLAHMKWKQMGVM
jgi:hypothetical protein